MDQSTSKNSTDHISREMWRLFEPIHSCIYFNPIAANKFKELGLKGGWMGYFASRSAPIGQASAELVYSTFYHFSPRLVERAIPDAWKYASPIDITEARLNAAEDILRKALKPSSNLDLTYVSHDLMKLATELPSAGRPLFAAHKGIDWNRSPELALFGAATLLREHRGDTHNAILLANQIDGLESHILQVASAATEFQLLFDNRGWTEQEWNDAANNLVKKGILESQSTFGHYILSSVGNQTKIEIENATNEFSNPWHNMSNDDFNALKNRLKRVSELIRTYVDFPLVNPIGV